MNDDDRGHRADPQDELASLIREAGRRRPIPAERAARVKAALHEQWRRDRRRRQQVRYLWGAVVLAAASLILIVRLPALFTGAVDRPVTGGIVGRVELVLGSWDGGGIAGSTTDRPLRARDELMAGATVETGPEGRLALRLTTGHSIRLDSDSRAIFPEAGAVRLDRGALYVDSGSRAGAARALRIQTPLGTVQEIGTQYEVRVKDGSVRVRVREGKVTVDDGREVREIRPANQLVLGPGLQVEEQPIPADGSEWSWVADLAVVPDLEGLTARAFLDWVARERGWTLRFSSEDLERSAGEILLSGSIRRLTPEEALGAVLPTCGMQHRVENGMLIVEPAALDARDDRSESRQHHTRS